MLDKSDIDLSNYRINKSKDLLSEADLLFENKKYDGCINRCYYAIFNAIRSLLALMQLDSSKHSGVLAFFDKYFIKTGILDRRYSKIAHSAFDRKQKVDYKDFYDTSDMEASSQLEHAKTFINDLNIVRIKLIENDSMLPPIEFHF